MYACMYACMNVMYVNDVNWHYYTAGRPLFPAHVNQHCCTLSHVAISRASRRNTRVSGAAPVPCRAGARGARRVNSSSGHVTHPPLVPVRPAPIVNVCVCVCVCVWKASSVHSSNG